MTAVKTLMGFVPDSYNKQDVVCRLARPLILNDQCFVVYIYQVMHIIILIPNGNL